VIKKMQNEKKSLESINMCSDLSTKSNHLDPMMRFGNIPQNLSKKKIDLLKETLHKEMR